MLVFFLLMSLVPMLFWGTLLFGKLHVGAPSSIGTWGLDGIKELLEYIRMEAQNATSGASVFLLITSLYSATNLFYQMRKSGELIYGTPYQGQGLRVRLGAVVALFLLLAIVLLTLLAFTLISVFATRLFGLETEKFLGYILLATLGFMLVLFLNLYICPYRASLKCFLPGSLMTVVSWVVSIVGFAIYLRIGHLDRLYGALTAVIVFLLWLYMLMIGFVVGVIFNSQRVLSGRIAKK